MKEASDWVHVLEQLPLGSAAEERVAETLDEQVR